MSFNELLIFTRLLFKWNNYTPDFIWGIYLSDNREIITKIPLIESMLKECSNEVEIEELIKSLAH